MFERLIQASLLTFLLAMILQIGSSSNSYWGSKSSEDSRMHGSAIGSFVEIDRDLPPPVPHTEV